VLDPYERLAQGATRFSCGRFRCRRCGHTAEEPFWQCPSCAVWATPQRLMPPSHSVPIVPGEGPPSLGHGSPEAAAPIVVIRHAPPQEQA
jgi:hypothetical protein